MPHSVSPAPSSSGQQEDVTLPDAPPEIVSSPENGLGTVSSYEAKAGNEGAVKKPSSGDIKLEDLFNDDESDDEEFPSSSATNGKLESSPPAAPV